MLARPVFMIVNRRRPQHERPVAVLQEAGRSFDLAAAFDPAAFKAAASAITEA
jgi:hypothetical protein